MRLAGWQVATQYTIHKTLNFSIRKKVETYYIWKKSFYSSTL
ncbi:hypothetical protein BVRB_6g127780 [Beta vulgaris subsp. vulgaris]|nr:hypothetical protein BVRB_6g127780 [Beta vulgaris subsp. vulgaris]